MQVRRHGERRSGAKPNHSKTAALRVSSVLWIAESTLQCEAENDLKKGLTAVISVLPESKDLVLLDRRRLIKGSSPKPLAGLSVDNW